MSKGPWKPKPKNPNPPLNCQGDYWETEGQQRAQNRRDLLTQMDPATDDNDEAMYE